MKSRKISYVPQQPWILNDTVRNNIVFGSTYNKHKYDEVIQASALDMDISNFTNGHDTEIIYIFDKKLVRIGSVVISMHMQMHGRDRKSTIL